MILEKQWHNLHSLQQLAYQRIRRLTGSHEAAIQNIKEKEKKAQEMLEQIMRTCCGIIQYIDLLWFMQKIPDL